METTAFISPRQKTNTRNGKSDGLQPSETVFDFNMTPEEIIEMFGYAMSEAEYKEFLSEDSRYADLYLLFRDRKDTERAQYYKSLIKSKSFRESLDYTDIILPENLS
jgi:hypothetical protein